MKSFSKFLRPRHNPSTKSDESSIADVVEKEALAAADVVEKKALAAADVVEEEALAAADKVRSRAEEKKKSDIKRAAQENRSLDEWYNMRANEAKLSVEAWHNARRNVINKQIEIQKPCYDAFEGAKEVYYEAINNGMSKKVAMKYAEVTYYNLIHRQEQDTKRYLLFKMENEGFKNVLFPSASRKPPQDESDDEGENDPMSAGGSGKRKSKRNRPGKKQRKRTIKKRTNKKRTNKKRTNKK